MTAPKNANANTNSWLSASTVSKSHTILFVFSLLLLLASCDEKRVVEYQSVADAEWERSDEKLFCVDSVSTSGTYDLSFLLRTDKDFPYLDLTVVVDETILPSHRHLTDTLTCHIFDSLGHVRGSGLSIFQHSYPIRTLHLVEGDSLHVSVRHVMKRIVLPGVADVGFGMERK